MTEEALRDRLIITMKITMVQAKLAARILMRTVASYADLAEVAGGRKHTANSVKVHVWRLNRMKAFATRKITVSNAYGHGYYFDVPTRAKIFKELGSADPNEKVVTPTGKPAKQAVASA